MLDAVSGRMLRSQWLANVELFSALGVLFGMIMPIVSAIIYPTWTHEMSPPWVEFTRLAELPFVASELFVIIYATNLGLRPSEIWKRLPTDVRVAAMLLGAGLLVSSTLFSRNWSASVTYSLIQLIHLRFLAAIWFLTRTERSDDVRRFLPLLGAGLAGIALLIAWRFAFPPPSSLVPGGVIEWDSAMPGFINVRHLGSWTGAIGAGLLLAIFYGERDKVNELLYLLAAAITVWSGTRAAVLAIILVAAIAVVTTRRLPEPRAIGRAAALTGAALILAWLLMPDDLPSFRLFAPSDMASSDAATGGRLTLWDATLHRWLQAPVWGWGSGSTFWEVYVGWSHTQPHNAVLQFLISWGLVGAAGALWLLGRAMVTVHAKGFRDTELQPLTGMLYALLFQSLLEGMLHYPRFIIAIAIGFGVLLARCDEAGSGSPTSG